MDEPNHMPANSRKAARPPLDVAALFNYAVGVLARRMRTERELRRLMRLRAEPAEPGEQAIEAVITRLKELSYLNDARFAADYTRLRKENEKLGPRRVRQDLTLKGVSKDLIGDAVTTAYGDEDEVALARQYIERKRLKEPTGENRQKEASRIMGRLLRAGFSSATVFKVLRQWGVDAEESEITVSDPMEDPDGE
jgi:regulatory protein